MINVLREGDRKMETRRKMETPILRFFLALILFAFSTACSEKATEPPATAMGASKVSRCVASIQGYDVLEEKRISAERAFRKIESRSGTRSLSVVEGRVLSIAFEGTDTRFANLRVERAEPTFFETNARVLREGAIFSANAVTESTLQGMPVLEWEPKAGGGAVLAEALLLDAGKSTSVSVQFLRAEGRESASQDRKILREGFMKDLATCLAL